MQGQPYDFTIPAGGAVQLAVCGSTAKILAASGAVQIQTDTGARILAMPGQGVRNFDFGKITLVDKSGAVNKGFIWIADADMIDDRITGEVSVIDGAKSRVLSNTAFCRSITFNPGGAAYGTAEIWNPAGSGKNLIVEELTLLQGFAAGAYFNVGFGNTAQYATPATGLSKKSGGVVSLGQIARNDEAVAGTGLNGQYVFAPPVNQTVGFGLKEPFIIQPGATLRVQASFVGSVVSVGFQWFEEPV